MVGSVVVHILDNSGRFLKEDVFNNVQKDNLTLNVEDLAAGTYMIRVITSEGTRTKKLTIVK
jgi:uncharacterized protein (DUF2141 family)